MVCQYCRANNDDENHRCSRCGRRMEDRSSSRRPEMFPVQNGAVAPVFDQSLRQTNDVATPARPQLVTELAKKADRQDYSVQGSLFGPQAVGTIAQPTPRRSSPPPAPRVRRDRSAQQKLEFERAFPEGARTLPTSVEAAVYCNAPVAMPTHRAIAAALDGAIIVAAIGVFVATFYFAGLEIVFTKETWPVYAGVAVLISLFYRILFCIGNTDTIGAQWAGLRLLNFDGRRPSRKQRFYRTAGTCVSIISSGIGFAWALVDEERLTWHDYISKTFPSPRIS